MLAIKRSAGITPKGAGISQTHGRYQPKSQTGVTPADEKDWCPPNVLKVITTIVWKRFRLRETNRDQENVVISIFIETDNPADLLKWLSRWTFQAISGASVSVDSFFVLRYNFDHTGSRLLRVRLLRAPSAMTADCFFFQNELDISVQNVRIQ